MSAETTKWGMQYFLPSVTALGALDQKKRQLLPNQ